MNKIKQIIRETIDNYLTEEDENILTLYHGTPKKEFDIKENDIWLASTIDYAKIWGDNIFEIQIRLNNVFDIASDLGNKRLTVKQ